jgi:hypothetical protein
MILLKKHKNMLFNCVAEAHLPVQRFAGSDEKVGAGVGSSGGEVFQISVVGSPLWFQVWTTSSLFEFGYRYNEMRRDFPARGVSAAFDEAALTQHFLDWLNGPVKVYIESEDAPDQWQSLKAYSRFMSMSGPATKADYEYFTKEEKAEILQSLSSFRCLLIAEYSPIPEQLASIDSRLDYLSKAVERLNRFDWRAVALSTAISIGINLSVDTETGRRVLELLQQAFIHGLRLLGAG